MKNSGKKLKRFALCIALIAAFVLSGAEPEIYGQKTGDETVKLVRAEKLPNVPGKTLTVAVVNYAPGGKSNKHHHAGSVLAYVLSGAIRSENSATGAVKIYQTGESFFEPAGSEHLISENASQTEPASLLAIFVAVDEAPLTTYGNDQAAVALPATPSEFVDALNSAFGKQTTNRATHAKGIVLLGKFTPNAGAKSLSKAPHFQKSVPVTVRFSDNTGIPTLADAAPPASPHGMAIKFHLPDGTETDLVTHSYNGFPGANAEETRQFFIAVGLSGEGVSAPTPIEKFMATHPAAKAFLTTQDPPPVSYATLGYFGVNSFKFINAAGAAVFIRYQIIPEAGKQFLSKEEIAKAAPEYLLDELRRRVAKTPIRFVFRVQISAPGDKIDDPSIAWSDKNKTVDLGVIEITQVVPDNEATNRALLFMPALLPAGIEAADPMIQFRNKTYPVSYERRHQQQ